MLDKFKRWRATNRQRRELEEQMRRERRLPPGQRTTLKFPIVHIGQVPPFDPKRWQFKIWGAVAKPVKFSWEEEKVHFAL